MTAREVERRKRKIDKGAIALAVMVLNYKSEIESFIRDLQIAQFKAGARGKKKRLKDGTAIAPALVDSTLHGGPR